MLPVQGGRLIGSVSRRPAIGIAMMVTLAASVASAQRARPGAPSPEIDLPTLAGGRVQLSKLRGHPVVVSFWGTW